MGSSWEELKYVLGFESAAVMQRWRAMVTMDDTGRRQCLAHSQAQGLTIEASTAAKSSHDTASP